ncbi:MAG: DUF5710 domain-containing protein [Betaproteobacteria bacterium]
MFFTVATLIFLAESLFRAAFYNAPPLFLDGKMRFNLKVPFAEKDQVKKLGARWDAARKLWYIEGKEDIAPFSRWSPTPPDVSGNDDQPKKNAPAKAQQLAGKTYVGSEYVEHSRVCDCPPWDVCDKCQAAVFSD